MGSTSAQMSASQFNGIVLKGNFHIDHLSIHRLEKQRIREGEVGLFDNKGKARIGSTLFVPSEDQFELRMKSIGERSFFFKPRQALSNGTYVAWAGTDFWLFQIK